VLDVLLLLAITRRFLESLDDEGRRRRNDRDGRLTVLDAELDSDAESFLNPPHTIQNQSHLREKGRAIETENVIPSHQ
jgi:hypothetical protein